MWEETMTKLIATAFAVALVSSVQAMPLAPPQPDNTLTLVRDACRAGMHRVNGVCVRTPASRYVPSSSSMAKQRKTTHRPAYGSSVVVEPTLLPEAARLKEMQKSGQTSPCATTVGTAFVLAI
jgi:hypothetical protein